MNETDLTTHIKQAIDNAGGCVAAAEATGARSYQTVQQWIAAGNVPSEYCPSLESCSGVSRLLLNKRAALIWPELAANDGKQAAA